MAEYEVYQRVWESIIVKGEISVINKDLLGYETGREDFEFSVSTANFPDEVARYFEDDADLMKDIASGDREIWISSVQYDWDCYREDFVESKDLDDEDDAKEWFSEVSKKIYAEHQHSCANLYASDIIDEYEDHFTDDELLDLAKKALRTF